MDIFRTLMHFLWVSVTFFNDVMATANPFPYTAKFMFVSVRNNKTKTRCVCERQMPPKRPFFEKCSLYI